MAHPARNAVPADILNPSRIFFATTKTSMGKRLPQSERNAGLLIDVLRSLVAEHAFKLIDFVIMPDHVHLLIEVAGDRTIEKAIQLIKGRFSPRQGIRLQRRGVAAGIHRGTGDEQGEPGEAQPIHR
jgi:putative transposase